MAPRDKKQGKHLKLRKQAFFIFTIYTKLLHQIIKMQASIKSWSWDKKNDFYQKISELFIPHDAIMQMKKFTACI